MDKKLVLVRGAGDLATGVLCTLHTFGYTVVAAETEKPSSIRRTVSLSEAVYEGSYTVENSTAEYCANKNDIPRILSAGKIPLLADPACTVIKSLHPDIVVDAIMAKKNTGTTKDMAEVVIGLGPGFTAGRDVHAVIETARGHDLGRVLFGGEAKSNTGVPGMICGYSIERVIYSPCAGVLHAVKKIGDHVNAGEAIAIVEGREICSKIPGTLRGIIRDGFFVTKGLKAADVDPRDTAGYCSTISDKARLIGFGVLQAITMLTKDKGEK